uniref:Protein mesh n=1 Tax=Syphacia muris TaxID=451379 RepID=A0A0N5A9S6_9BILA
MIRQWLVFVFASICCVFGQISDDQQTFSSHPRGTLEQGNLLKYGTTVGDYSISNNQQPNGYKILLSYSFPFYGGRYNYTLISTNGYVGFGYFSDSSSHDFVIGKDSGYPTKSDPAFIAPYLCRQKIGATFGRQSAIYYRVEMRSVGSVQYITQNRNHCSGRQRHIYCDHQSNLLLDEIQLILQVTSNLLAEGVAGASAFRADSALIVTWENVQPSIGNENTFSTYQLIWATDAAGTLSYTIINYDRLGYEASDLNGGTQTGRCRALFNGGNQTGTVMVDLSSSTKDRPSSLAERSSVPHIVRGRYLHRVDDVVRPCGCSNKTGGTFPMMIYPNIVNMLGQKSVEVNALCLDPHRKYNLMIEQRDVGLSPCIVFGYHLKYLLQTAPCDVINSAIARCYLPRILDWGTKTVYFQPADLANDEKAYIGYMYFVPPTLDPMRLDIGNVYQWFANPVPENMHISWYPRNFTNRAVLNGLNAIDNPSLYAMQLGLYVVGYKEAADKNAKKFVPTYRVLARVTTIKNPGDEKWRWNLFSYEIRTTEVEEWYLTEWERENELYTYRFGYLKLAPVLVITPEMDHVIDDRSLQSGILSSPISIHWLWTIGDASLSPSIVNDREEKKKFIKYKATQMCKDWFDEDGTLTNFIRTTETNASCPCKEIQAKLDIGRFMPHPRCSQLFRDVTCTETLGSRNCYMSAQNVRGVFSDVNHPGSGRSLNTAFFYSYSTHYGQVCCYDDFGYLMQSSYQPLIKIDESTPYSPGFPMRAYEFGTYPYQGMFEASSLINACSCLQIFGLSAFHHDMMPYYLCCKYADFRCQMFYWRRPSSACQEYEPPNIASIMGAGSITTLNRNRYVYNDPGIYNLLYASEASITPQVRIQGRFERFPDRSVPFGIHFVSSVDQQQQELVQPSNVTVLTGIALDSSDSDRVHVILRKDTARGRYRTTILVNDVIRYFDHMQLQRFKGVTIYVNDVQRGQAEVYVVLDKAQIGIRIRESYALDMDRFATYMESFGLLDILVSVPPQYKTHATEELNSEKTTIEGLLCPYDDSAIPEDVKINEKINEYSAKYRVKSESQVMTVSKIWKASSPFQLDLFDSSSDSVWHVLPDADLKQAVYVASSQYYRTEYHRPTVQTLEEFKQFCKNREKGYVDQLSYELWSKEYKRCPQTVFSVEDMCGTDKSCEIDAIYLQANALGYRNKEEFQTLQEELQQSLKKYNSCGAISLEYPEYMRRGSKSSAPAYLEGDHAFFSCFQDHVAKGDMEYHCSREPSYHDSNVFITRWNHGYQPWCRPRTLDNFITWSFWIGVVIAAIALIAIIFLFCWTIKQKHIKKQTRKSSVSVMPKSMEMQPLNDIDPLPVHYDKNVKKITPASSFNDSYFSNVEAPSTMVKRSHSQPFLDNYQQVESGFVRPYVQQRRPSYSGLSGLSTGV